MRKITYYKTMLLAIMLVAGNTGSWGQTFTAGNLAVFQAAASSNNTSGAILELNPGTANQTTAVNSYSIDANKLRFSGSATSTGYMANSNDGTLVCFTGGYNSTSTGNVNTILSRGVGTLNSSYSFNVAATYTGASGSQTRCATSIDNTNFYIADQGGQFTNNATTASPTSNIRAIKSFGGVVYLGQSSSTAATIEISTASAITGGTITGLPGLTNQSTHQDFYLVSSGTNGSTYDILYSLRSASATVGTIAKYSLVSGTWTANGTYTTNFGGFGLCASYNSGSTNLYVTSGAGATTANKVYGLVDAAGYNTTINITTANILYTAATGTILKGIAFAPVPTSGPTPVATPTFSGTSGNVINSQDITISSSTTGASIYYTIDGTDPNNAGNGMPYTTPLTISSTTTLKAIAYNGLTTSSIASATYTFPSVIADITTLKKSSTNGFYQLTSQPTLTFMDNAGSVKFIQDATAGIVIYDKTSKITTPYAIGDKIPGIYCTLSMYNGMLELIPFSDPGTAVSSGNVVTPTVVTLTSIANYAGQLVTVKNVAITGTGNFVASVSPAYTSYPINDGTSAGVLRVAYTDLPYVGDAIPTANQDITGVVNMYSTTEADLIPRTAADMVNSTVTSVKQASTNSGIYASNGKVIFSATAGEVVEIYNAVGQKLVHKLAVEGMNTIPVSDKGILLVKVGNLIAKVIL